MSVLDFASGMLARRRIDAGVRAVLSAARGVTYFVRALRLDAGAHTARRMPHLAAYLTEQAADWRWRAAMLFTAAQLLGGVALGIRMVEPEPAPTWDDAVERMRREEAEGPYEWPEGDE